MPDGIPYYYSIGSPEEAIIYVIDSKATWGKTPGAIQWLHKCL